MGAPLRCARCGYDLSGLPAASTDACRVHGRCSECGHAFRWADVFNPALNDLPWLAEHARSRRGFGRRIAGTFVRACWPARYWREVSVDARVRVRPLVLFVAIVWAVPWLVSAVLYGMELHRGWNFRNSAMLRRLNVPEWQEWLGVVVNSATQRGSSGIRACPSTHTPGRTGRRCSPSP